MKTPSQIFGPIEIVTPRGPVTAAGLEGGHVAWTEAGYELVPYLMLNQHMHPCPGCWVLVTARMAACRTCWQQVPEQRRLSNGAGTSPAVLWLRAHPRSRMTDGAATDRR